MKAILIVLASAVSLCATAMPIGLRTAMVSPAAVSPNTLPRIAEDASAGDVNATLDGVGFADAEIKEAIGGSAAEYAAFREWAQCVRQSSGNPGGGVAVVASPHAAAAYLLGAERLFENEPTVEITEVSVAADVPLSGGEGAAATQMTVAVTVKDGERVVAVDADKVAAMFEATCDLGDWSGASKLTPTATTLGTDASGKMTFTVTPGDGTAEKAFLRIKR